MGLKCPCCGFDSADGALFCDFCKQPFRRKAAQPVPAPSAPAPVSAGPVADELRRLTEGLPSEVVQKIPLHLLSEDQKTKPVEPWVRWAAWIFLGLWVFVGCLVAGMWLARYQQLQDEQSPGDTVIIERR